MNKQINEFKEILNSNYRSKCDLIEKQIYLNIFVYDKVFGVRGRVAVKGYYHDILQYDKNWYIRRTVAYNTKDKSILEHLSNDENNNIRDLAIIRLKELYNE